MIYECTIVDFFYLISLLVSIVNVWKKSNLNLLKKLFCELVVKTLLNKENLFAKYVLSFDWALHWTLKIRVLP